MPALNIPTPQARFRTPLALMRFRCFSYLSTSSNFSKRLCRNPLPPPSPPLQTSPYPTKTSLQTHPSEQRVLQIKRTLVQWTSQREASMGGGPPQCPGHYILDI